MEKIIVGADAYGMDLKNSIKTHLEKAGYEVEDVGTYELSKPIPFYEVAAIVAMKIQDGQAKRGILFCGTGMGVSIVANKFKGIYASVVESAHAAKMCKAINNSNVLTMGQMFVSEYYAKMAVDNWLGTKHTEGFEPGLAKFLADSLGEIRKIEDKLFP